MQLLQHVPEAGNCAISFIRQLVGEFLVRTNNRNRAIHLVSPAILVLVVQIEANEEHNAESESGKRSCEARLSCCQQPVRAVAEAITYLVSRRFSCEIKLWAADVADAVCNENCCTDCASLGESCDIGRNQTETNGNVDGEDGGKHQSAHASSLFI